LPAFAAAALGALALAVPAAAWGDAYLGSTSLVGQAPASAQLTPIDTVYWLTALANGRPVRVAQSGQILQFSLRGHTVGTTPAPIHFQLLRPGAGSQLTIVASSQAYPLPTADGVWSFDPVNFCVQAGDYLGLNEEGGTQVDAFAPINGSTTDVFGADRGTMNGNIVTPNALPNVELLLAAYEGTGVHASPLCGGISGVELHVRDTVAHVSKGGATTLTLACTGPLPCSGSLRLSASVPAARHTPAHTLLLTSASFAVASRGERALALSVSTAGRQALKAHKGGLAGLVTAILGSAPDDTVTSSLKLTG
jgi:hypothetical protein